MTKTISMHTNLSKGFTLIEVLISLMILSLMLLMLDNVLLLAIRQTQSAYFFSLAVQQLNSMSDFLRLAPTEPDLVKRLTVWNQQNKTLLPRGKGMVKGEYPTYTITIFWGTWEGQRSCPEIIIGPKNCLKEKITL